MFKLNAKMTFKNKDDLKACLEKLIQMVETNQLESNEYLRFGNCQIDYDVVESDDVFSNDKYKKTVSIKTL